MSEMFDLRRFPVSDEFNSYRKTFFVTEMKFYIFSSHFLENMNFQKMHGNVGNDFAHRMEALPDARGTGIQPDSPSEGAKCQFSP